MLHAVIIGIDRYADPNIGNLRAARADAEALSRLLRSRIAGSERTVATLLDGKATKKEILRAVGEVLPRKQTEEDLILIYFAGHGSPEQINPPDHVSRYLVAADTEFEQVFATGIGLETEICTLLERQFTRRLLLILDSCFSGQAGGRTFMGPRLAQRVAQFRSRITLSDLDLGYGRVILAACRDHELASEKGDHGVFTGFLLEALCAAGDDPTIGVAELYERVFRSVRRATAQLQNPVLKGYIEGMRLPRLGKTNPSSAFTRRPRGGNA